MIQEYAIDLQVNYVWYAAWQIAVTKVELVKGMGVCMKATDLSNCLRKAKRQPTKLLRLLMDALFTEEELATCTVRGRYNKIALDQDTMTAILCELN